MKYWQHEKKLRNLRIKKSNIPNAGKGLFTTKYIPKGAVIAGYTGERVINKDPNYGNPYALQIKKYTFIDASKSNTAEGRFANDCRGACKNNALLQYDKANKKAFLAAKHNIKAGSEITTSYGKDYWKNIRNFVVPKRKKIAKMVKIVKEPVKMIAPLVKLPVKMPRKEPRRIAPIKVVEIAPIVEAFVEAPRNRDLPSAKRYLNMLKEIGKPGYFKDLERRAKRAGYGDI